MAWWDDLWLNEGFASYMEYDGSDKIVPEYQMVRNGSHLRVKHLFFNLDSGHI